MRKAASPRSSSTALCRISCASALLLSRFARLAVGAQHFSCHASAAVRRRIAPSTVQKCAGDFVPLHFRSAPSLFACSARLRVSRKARPHTGL